MESLFKKIHSKINHLIWSLGTTGILMLMIAVLIVFANRFLELIASLLALVISYVFVYGAYKLWCLKKDIENYFKF